METVLAKLAQVIEQLTSVAPGVWAAAQGQARVAMAVDLLMFGVWLVVAICAVLLGRWARPKLDESSKNVEFTTVDVAMFVAILGSIGALVGMIAVSVDYISVRMNPDWRAIEVLMSRFGLGR